MPAGGLPRTMFCTSSTCFCAELAALSRARASAAGSGLGSGALIRGASFVRAATTSACCPCPGDLHAVLLTPLVRRARAEAADVQPLLRRRQHLLAVKLHVAVIPRHCEATQPHVSVLPGHGLNLVLLCRVQLRDRSVQVASQPANNVVLAVAGVQSLLKRVLRFVLPGRAGAVPGSARGAAVLCCLRSVRPADGAHRFVPSFVLDLGIQELARRGPAGRRAVERCRRQVPVDGELVLRHEMRGKQASEEQHPPSTAV
eukprot:scaffold13459_cov67-Phaeocystis_antarctica.AAC.2